MQTAARLDFIGLPRLRGCGGSVFLCWKGRIFGGRLWFVSARLGLGAAWIVGARLELARGCGLCRRGWGWCEAGLWGRGLAWRETWIVSTRVGLGARLWIASARVGLGRGCELCRRGWVWRAAVNCGGGMTVMRRYRNCVKRRCGKKVRKVANL